MPEPATVDMSISLTRTPDEWTGPKHQVLQWPVGLKIPDRGERIGLVAPDGQVLGVTVIYVGTQIIFKEAGTEVSVSLLLAPTDETSIPRARRRKK